MTGCTVRDPSNGLSSIPEQDQQILRQFFYRVLFKESMIYVLCGSKPMGTACFTSSLVPEMDSVKNNQILKEGWKTWCKYKQIFPKKNLIFRIVGNEDKDTTIKILLIRKDLVRKTLRNQREIFEQILGHKLDIDQMLDIFEFDNDPIQTALMNNHVLIGILHGFGVHNSQFFQMKWDELEKVKSQFSSQREMFEHIKNPLKETLEKENHPILNLPRFAVDSSDSETDFIRKQYEKERAEILKKCESRDLLQLVINEWR